ncbi:MAG: SRPBCC domain-containing protein [Steroidobacteraceae bacterium]|nr:SRPBCC domain-containing protein [Steroidobacteraceae bacterium]
MNRCRPAAAMLTAPALALALALSLPLAGVAEGAVTASTADGFTLVIEVDVKAPPQLAYRELTVGPAAWWDPEHTYSGKAERLTLDARAGGCFCESMDGGASVSHGTVIYADPGQMLRLSTALGPLQAMAVVGTLSFAFAPREAGSHVTLTYRVFGAFTEDAVALSKLVDSVLTQQMGRFAAHVNGKD